LGALPRWDSGSDADGIRKKKEERRKKKEERRKKKEERRKKKFCFSIFYLPSSFLIFR
jgi:ribosomal protein L12E/L44/L45/RPP1/RPP2